MCFFMYNRGKTCICDRLFLILPRSNISYYMKVIIGKNLSKLRSANNLTQQQVADCLGITRSAYSNYEDGVREAPMDVLLKSADLFGTDVHLLLERNEDVVDNMLVCAFRVDDMSADDLREILGFKRIVKNYMKIKRLFEDEKN